MANDAEVVDRIFLCTCYVPIVDDNNRYGHMYQLVHYYVEACDETLAKALVESWHNRVYWLNCSDQQVKHG